jgi:hypothetical protein
MRRAAIAIAAAVAALALAAGAADATSPTVLHFKGSADADAQTEVTFEVSGQMKKVKKGRKTRRVFVAKTVSNVHVEDQLFTCYDAAGNPVQSGRFSSQYEFFAIEPMTVSRSGAFSGSHEVKVENSVVSRVTFTGTIKGRTVKGTFQAQYDPGGIEYGYCGNATGEPYTAKG